MPRVRLALRIYLTALALIAAVVLGLTLLLVLRAASERRAEREARGAVEAVAASLGRPEALARELARVEDATVAIFDDRGQVLATNRREGDPPPPSPPPGSPPGPPPGPPPPPLFPPLGPPLPAFVMPVRLPDGVTGRALYALRAPRSKSRDGLIVVGFVLVVVGVGSLLTARSLAEPLSRLSRAARALGAGHLDTRVGLSRSDEIGEVAAAFDEMADRIAGLLRAEKELLANVSHELRTPLSRIRVALDLAAEGDAETGREALSEIGGDLAELERLISDVLTAARLDLGPGVAGIPPLREERIDTGEMLTRAASRFMSAHPERALLVELAEDLSAVDGDPALLHRVIDNLLENAHRYSKDKAGEVRLGAVSVDGGVRIEVRDHGVGIAPEDLPKVFRPFFRADRSRARATGGLGLGLALARRIVEAHRGSIELESRLGEGTCAVVRLPAVR